MAPPDAESLRALEAVVNTASTLIEQLQSMLGNVQKSPATTTGANDAVPADSPPLDAIALARDSTALIRAHSTKVSLLIINEPFTPSAISTVVRELITGPIPGLASSVQVCDPKLYTSIFRKEMAYRSQRVLTELRGLLERIPKDGKVVAADKRRGFGPEGKGSISSTGMLWTACDQLTEFANGGVGGFFVQRVQQWRDTLQDVMEELKEWGEKSPEDDDEDDNDDAVSNDSGYQTPQNKTEEAQDLIDDLMGASDSIPANDPDKIRPRLETSLKRLRLITLLYQATTKLRLKKLPSFPPSDANLTIHKRLEEASDVLEKLPEQLETLAGALYEQDPEEIDEAMEECFSQAVAASEILAQGWDGSEDEFTAWTMKFKEELKKEAL